MTSLHNFAIENNCVFYPVNPRFDTKLKEDGTPQKTGLFTTKDWNNTMTITDSSYKLLQTGYSHILMRFNTDNYIVLDTDERDVFEYFNKTYCTYWVGDQEFENFPLNKTSTLSFSGENLPAWAKKNGKELPFGSKYKRHIYFRVKPEDKDKFKEHFSGAFKGQGFDTFYNGNCQLLERAEATLHLDECYEASYDWYVKMFNDLCEKFPDFNKTQSCYITKKPYYTKPTPKQETKRVVQAHKIVRKPVVSESDDDSESDDESETTTTDGDTFRRILEGLNPKRWEHFDSWLKISFIVVNEKQPIDLFHELSKKFCPQKFDKEANERIIRNHKPLGSGYSIATLYLWLKEDNNALFKELQASRRDIWKILYEMNHSDLAKLYYNLNPNKYVRSAITGWYEYNTYNVLESFGQSPPSSLLSSITDTLQTYITEQRSFCLPKGKDDKDYEEKMKTFKRAYCTFGTAPYIQNVMKYLTELYTVNKICINDVWVSINDLFDSKTNLLAFDDKVYDIEKKAFRDITPTDYITMTTKYRAPTKSNPKMRKRITDLLNSIFGDKEILNYWLTTTGLGMFCGSKFESLYVHTGSGGNGKGVLSSYLERALGDYFLVAENTFLTTSFKAGAPNPTLAKSKGVRMLLVSEPDDGKEGKLNVDFVKAMTGGDSITARDMYKSTITFKPQFTCMLQCNNKPQFSKIDGGIARRVKVIHYPFRFVDTPNPENVREKQKDSSLKDEAERPEFINEFMLLLLEHASANYSIKTIPMPSDVKESTQDYMNENNHIKPWLESNIVLSKSDKDRIKADELYRDYKMFDEGEGATKVSNVVFAREMDFNNIEKKKISGVQYYLRIKFAENNTETKCDIQDLKEKDL